MNDGERFYHSQQLRRIEAKVSGTYDPVDEAKSERAYWRSREKEQRQNCILFLVFALPAIIGGIICGIWECIAAAGG